MRSRKWEATKENGERMTVGEMLDQRRAAVPMAAQEQQTQLGSIRMRVCSLASLSGVVHRQAQIPHCCGCGVGWQL